MTPCPLDPSVGLILVEPGQIDGLDFRKTHALAVYGEDVEQPLILLDATVLQEPWFTDDHLLVVLAHELGHIHSASESEDLADLVGMMLLLRQGHITAVELHIQEYKARMSGGSYQKEEAA